MKKRIGISMGDPGGIGPEVTLAALVHPEIVTLRKKTCFVLFGSYAIYAELQKKFNVPLELYPISSVKDIVDSENIPVYDIGFLPHDICIASVCKENATCALDSLDAAIDHALRGAITGIVTAPINKEAVQLLLPDFSGHTEYLAQRSGVKKFAMLIQGGPLRVVFVTTHVPLKAVSEKLTRQEIETKISLLYQFLKKNVGLAEPRIGVAALNPHGGEGTKMGREEVDIIIPAIKAVCEKEKITVSGPIPADVIFHAAMHGKLDGIVAMYHDQGLGPLKMIAFETGVNITLNLPFIRTSPDHGTAFDIAYKNCAHTDSMREAIKTAASLSR